MASDKFNDAPADTSLGAKPPGQMRDVAPEMVGKNRAQLASWVMTRVNRWRQVRDNAYLDRWDEYYRLWRGVWSDSDKSRRSERSRIIAPALAESIDLTHAELTDAVFGRERWINVSDDVADEDQKDQEANLDVLLEDLDHDGVPDALIKTIQIGCLYGTGAVKVSTEVEKVREYVRQPSGKTEAQEREVTAVKVYPLDPRELVPDPAASCIEDMLGVAHETIVPLHEVQAHQRSGYFFEGTLPSNPSPDGTTPPSGVKGDTALPEDAVYATEYHGKVPAGLLAAAGGEQLAEEADEDELVEAIVTIGNYSTLLRAKKNPLWMEDRAIVAYQHESVPGEFWGRGVAEKGYNAQKALDAEMRMRIDSLALVAAPMVAADKSRLPRGFDMRVFPGKEWPTVGNPSEVIYPFNFGQLNPNTFNQGADLERMVKQGTGAMDPGTSLSQGSRRDTMGGTAMMAASTVKRAKRTMFNIENQLLRPLIQKVMWRYMQFSPDRYKADFKFSVRGAMGMMAREYEMQLQTQLYQMTPPESQAHPLILRGIYAMSSSPDRQRIIDAIDAQLAPPDDAAKQEQAQLKQLQMRKLTAEVNKLENEAANQGAQASEHAAKAGGATIEARLRGPELQIEAQRVQNDMVEAATYAAQTRQQHEHQKDEHRTETALRIHELALKDKEIRVKEKAAANKPKAKA
jgi:hypothetical protein